VYEDVNEQWYCKLNNITVCIFVYDLFIIGIRTQISGTVHKRGHVGPTLNKFSNFADSKKRGEVFIYNSH